MIDDFECMTRQELKRHARMLRGDNEQLIAAITKFLAADGNDMCHENRDELATAAGLIAPQVRPLPFFHFLFNCVRYRVKLAFNKQHGGCRCPSKSQT